MKERIISAIVMCVICLPFLIIGGMLFKIGMGILSIIALKEIFNLKKEKKYPIPVLAISGLSLLLLEFLPFNIKIICACFVAMFLLSVFFFEENKFTTNEAFTLSTFIVFLGLVFNYLTTLYLNEPLYFILLVMVCVCTDVFAYATGMNIGKHKITKISPKKSLEGFLGGLIMGTIISSTYYMIFIGYAPFIKVLLSILVLSFACEIGDLFYSAVKRQAHIKDFSNLIPGHGGLLDRIDSLTIVTLVYIIIEGLI